ncbi:MAG: hypothetical protein Q8R31_05930 [Candidatus Omnitrophota bacterium]|nr:hypothetical protein [Candidatus Omnitrophota bacterium]
MVTKIQKMKNIPNIIFSSKDDPRISSGYGVIAKYLAPLLADRYGRDKFYLYCPVYQRDHTGVYKGIRILPGVEFGYDDQTLLAHAQRLHNPIILQIGDIWPLNFLPDAAARNDVMWIQYLMCDFLGFPEILKQRLKYIYNIVPSSKWGEKLLRENNFTNVQRAIWCGLDIDLWKPLDRKDLPETMRSLGFTYEPESLNIMVVAANQERKGIRQTLEAIGIFKTAHPDITTRLYMHTMAKGERDLLLEATELGIQDLMVIPDFYKILTGGVEESELVRAFNCADVVMNCCLDGFGFAHIHSQAVGVPCIYYEHGAGPELVVSGIKIPAFASKTYPNQNMQSEPNPFDIANALHEVMQKKKQKGILRSEKAQQFVRENLDWKTHIAPQWYEVLDKAIADYDRYCWTIPEISQKLVRLGKKEVVIK